jgi:thymidylate kinase
MSKLYFVNTEEGVEGSGQKTPLEALVEYLEFDEVTEKRINEILSGKSEIDSVSAYTKAELNAMPEQ